MGKLLVSLLISNSRWEILHLAPYLVSDSDLGKDYSPENDEPTYYKTDEIFQKFATYLEEEVLRLRLAT